MTGSIRCGLLELSRVDGAARCRAVVLTIALLSATNCGQHSGLGRSGEIEGLETAPRHQLTKVRHVPADRDNRFSTKRTLTTATLA